MLLKEDMTPKEFDALAAADITHKTCVEIVSAVCLLKAKSCPSARVEEIIPVGTASREL